MTNYKQMFNKENQAEMDEIKPIEMKNHFDEEVAEQNALLYKTIKVLV